MIEKTYFVKSLCIDRRIRSFRKRFRVLFKFIQTDNIYSRRLTPGKQTLHSQQQFKPQQEPTC